MYGMEETVFTICKWQTVASLSFLVVRYVAEKHLNNNNAISKIRIYLQTFCKNSVSGLKELLVVEY